MKFAKMSAESGRWDDVASQIARTEASLQELSDAEKEPIVAELSSLRKAVEEAQRAEHVRTVLDRAKRNMRTARMALDDRYFDQVEDRIASALGDRDLAALGDAEKAPLLAEAATLREAAAKGQREKKAEAVVRSIDQNLRGCRPDYPEQNAGLLARATEVLDSEEARALLAPEVIEGYRARIAELRGSDVEAKRREQRDRMTAQLASIEEALASGAWSSVESRINGARATLALLAPDDAPPHAQRLDTLEAAFAGGVAAQKRDTHVKWLTENWTHVKGELAGWEVEDPVATWADVWDRRQSDLMMPKTVAALRQLGMWLDRTRTDEYAADPAVIALVAEATAVHEQAATRLQRAFDEVIAGGEAAPTPTLERDIEQLGVYLVHPIDSWFGTTRHLEDNRRRAKALHARWTQAHADYRQAGLDLYAQLSAEARAAWPAIAAAIATESGFDPSGAGAWKDRTVRFQGVYNRIGWDYDGGYDVAITINGIPVAGSYERAIAEAVRDVQQRTHMAIDDHAPWDVIAVIQGSGSIRRRNVREIGYTKVESWDPLPCVVMRIIALHAGPIAMGPDRP